VVTVFTAVVAVAFAAVVVVAFAGVLAGVLAPGSAGIGVVTVRGSVVAGSEVPGKAAFFW